ncbi:winged helix-turn-helix domain-containing protein [Nocardiopsis sp. CT-R113]|uniref:Winged helix-turn-helix domain-containing protein n=1 Tax=Nocardiopsis codii TaxID=3065942 RepID=A0ABU7KD82_9ACTN|nr:winged helix-turn-helix domain-containing protein [Nocardiopsis sp. CT-R113]MEE2040190.1 winged helix-turn-helix domain-containing protein [Nocardiopsis sp. CT-R113]
MKQRAGWGTYKQVAAELTGRIEDGRLPAGGPVPSEAALGREFGVSRTVVRRALAVLEKAGLVRAVPGVGRVVSTSEERARPAGKVPAPFRLIARDLRERITSGDLAEGDPLPSESDLQRAYGVSRTTARHAFAALEGAGLVSVVQGKGRVVTRR